MVRANVVKQSFVTSAKEFIDFMAGWILALQLRRSNIVAQKTLAEANARAILKEPPPPEAVPTRFSKWKRGADRLAEAVVSLITSDVEQLRLIQAQTNQIRRAGADQFVRQAAELAVQLQGADAALTKVVESQRNVVASLEIFGAAKLWTTMPWGVIPVGDYSFNRENGLITFSDLCGIIDASATYDLELANLISDGLVEVTFNHVKRDTDSPSDWTYFIFQANPNGGEPDLVRISEQSNLKPAVIKDEKIVIYENEALQGINFSAAARRAEEIARPILQPPYQQDGYSYVYPGFLRVETDDSVNEVTWEFDGDMAHTRILANFPDGTSGWRTLTRKSLDQEAIYG